MQKTSVSSAETGDFMNDKSLECLKFYDMQIKKMVKGRGGIILFTDRGCRLFLECSRNDGFYLRDVFLAVVYHEFYVLLYIM